MAKQSRKSVSLIACSLCVALSAPCALAQSLDQLEARLKEHPSLAAMGQHSDALRESATAAGGWPDPVVSIGINNFPVFNPSFGSFLPTNKAIGVRQAIPNGTQRRVEADIALRLAAQNDTGWDLQFARLRAELIIALIEQRRISEQTSLLKEKESWYGELGQVVEGEMAAGRPALYRLAEIDLQRAEVSRSLADLAGEAAQFKARLIDLVGEDVNVPPPGMQATHWSGDPMAFHTSRLADKGIAVADAAVAKAQAAWGPDWGVQLTYQQRDRGSAGTPSPGDDWVSAAVTFSVPFWARRSQAPALRAAMADREAARSRYLAAARHAEAEFSTLHASRLAAEAAMAALKEQIASIDERAAAQRTRYESGLGDYSPVIDSELARLVLLGGIAAEQARRGRAIAQLNALMVTS